MFIKITNKDFKLIYLKENLRVKAYPVSGYTSHFKYILDFSYLPILFDILKLVSANSVQQKQKLMFFEIYIKIRQVKKCI